MKSVSDERASQNSVMCILWTSHRRELKALRPKTCSRWCRVIGVTYPAPGEIQPLSPARRALQASVLGAALDLPYTQTVPAHFAAQPLAWYTFQGDRSMSQDVLYMVTWFAFQLGRCAPSWAKNTTIKEMHQQLASERVRILGGKLQHRIMWTSVFPVLPQQWSQQAIAVGVPRRTPTLQRAGHLPCTYPRPRQFQPALRPSHGPSGHFKETRLRSSARSTRRNWPCAGWTGLFKVSFDNDEESVLG